MKKNKTNVLMFLSTLFVGTLFSYSFDIKAEEDPWDITSEKGYYVSFNENEDGTLDFIRHGYQGYSTNIEIVGSVSEVISDLEDSGLSWTEGECIDRINAIGASVENGANYHSDWYNQVYQYDVQGTDGNTYMVYMDYSTGQVGFAAKDATNDIYNVSPEVVLPLLAENDVTKIHQKVEDCYNAAIAEALQNNNLLDDGWFGTDGMTTDCKEALMNGSGATSETCQAYERIMNSEYATNTLLNQDVKIRELANRIESVNPETLTPQQIIDFHHELDNLLASYGGRMTTEAYNELMALMMVLESYNAYDMPQCPDGEEMSDQYMTCVPVCNETTLLTQGNDGGFDCVPIETNPSENAITHPGSGGLPEENATGNIDEPTVTPPITPEVTEAPFIPEETLKDCEENTRLNTETMTCEPILPAPENPVTPEDETENQEFIDTMKEQLSGITMDTYEGQNPINVEIGGLKAQIYIKNSVDLMSSDNANFSKLQQNTNGTFSYVQNDDQGRSTIYSKAYDANGEVITDLVITSTQFGLVTFEGNDNLVKSNSIIKLYGSGTQESYTTYGYGEVSIGNTNRTFGIEGSYKADSTKANRKDMISINILAIGGETIQDSLRGVVHEAIYQMENYNYESFIVAPVTMETLGETTITLTLIDDKDSRVVEVAENGQKVTYKYEMHQLVTSSNGDMYSLIDVMKHNLYDLEVLINAGFEVTRNGELITADTIGDLTYNKLLGYESSSLARPTIDPENPDAPTVTPTPLPSENRELVAIGDTLTPDRIDEANQNNPEYVWSSDTHDYYIPEGIVDDIEFKFYNKETEEYETLTFSEALAKGYITPEEMKEALEKQGINVYAVEKMDTKPSFRVVTKELETEEEYVDNITKFWEDNAYEYAFENAETYDRTYILTSNGLKYTLDYVLKHNVYSIDELIENGLNCIKTTKAAGIVSSMAIVDSNVYRDIYVNEDTANGGIYVGTKLFSSVDDLTGLPENLKKALEDKFGSLENYFDSGKSFILYGICSENGKTSFATSLSVKDDTLYANIGYAPTKEDDEKIEENVENVEDIETTMVNYVDVISFNNEDALSKANEIEKISDMKVSVNIKDLVNSDDEDNSNDKVAIVQTKYDTIIAHGQDINGVQLYNSLEDTETLPTEIKTEIVDRVGDLETFFNEEKSFVLYGIESNTTHKPQDFYKIEVKDDTLVAVLVNVPKDVDAIYGQAFTYYVDMVAFENAGVIANSSVDSIDELKLGTRVSEVLEVDDENNEDNSNDEVAIVQTTYTNISKYGSSLSGASLYTNLDQAKQLPEDIQQAIVDKVGDLETFFNEEKSFVLYGLHSNTSRKASALNKIEVKDDKIIAVLTTIEDEPGTMYLQALTDYVDMVAFENAGVIANSSVDSVDKLTLSTRTQETNEVEDNSKEIIQTTYSSIKTDGSLEGTSLYTNLDQVKQLPEIIQNGIVEKVGDLETFFNEGKSFVLFGVTSSTTHKPVSLDKIMVSENKIVPVISSHKQEPDVMYGQAITHYLDMVVFENDSVLKLSTVDKIDEITLEPYRPTGGFTPLEAGAIVLEVEE